MSKPVRTPQSLKEYIAEFPGGELRVKIQAKGCDSAAYKAATDSGLNLQCVTYVSHLREGKKRITTYKGRCPLTNSDIYFRVGRKDAI